MTYFYVYFKFLLNVEWFFIFYLIHKNIHYQGKKFDWHRINLKKILKKNIFNKI